MLNLRVLEFWRNAMLQRKYTSGEEALKLRTTIVWINAKFNIEKNATPKV